MAPTNTNKRRDVRPTVRKQAAVCSVVSDYVYHPTRTRRAYLKARKQTTSFGSFRSPPCGILSPGLHRSRDCFRIDNGTTTTSSTTTTTSATATSGCINCNALLVRPTGPERPAHAPVGHLKLRGRAFHCHSAGRRTASVVNAYRRCQAMLEPVGNSHGAGRAIGQRSSVWLWVECAIRSFRNRATNK